MRIYNLYAASVSMETQPTLDCRFDELPVCIVMLHDRMNKTTILTFKHQSVYAAWDEPKDKSHHKNCERMRLKDWLPSGLSWDQWQPGTESKALMASIC